VAEPTAQIVSPPLEAALNYGNLFLIITYEKEKFSQIQALAYSSKITDCWNTAAQPERFFPPSEI